MYRRPGDKKDRQTTSHTLLPQSGARRWCSRAACGARPLCVSGSTVLRCERLFPPRLVPQAWRWVARAAVCGRRAGLLLSRLRSVASGLGLGLWLVRTARFSCCDVWPSGFAAVGALRALGRRCWLAASFFFPAITPPPPVARDKTTAVPSPVAAACGGGFRQSFRSQLVASHPARR